MQAPLTRPSAVKDFEGGDLPAEFPVDIVCIVQVLMPGPHDGVGGPDVAADDELHDVVLYQWYEDDPTGPNPFVPHHRYVYLSDSFDMCKPGDLKRPALLIPNLTPPAYTRFRRALPKGSAESGGHPRPCFLWLEQIQ